MTRVLAATVEEELDSILKDTAPVAAVDEAAALDATEESAAAADEAVV